MTLQLLHSEFPLYEENLIFRVHLYGYFCVLKYMKEVVLNNKKAKKKQH
jgi:hypothetical protein